MKSLKPLISIIIPAHNEAENLLWHHKQIIDYIESNAINIELIYVDDGSTDTSLDIIRTLAKNDTRVRYISFSRNFGKEPATSAGLHASRGDAAIIIDADGQHPIEILDQFIEKWRAGSQVIIGLRVANTNEGIVKRYGSKLYSTIMKSVIKNNAPSGSTDFRLIDRKVIDEFCKLNEHNRITRGLIDWLGYKRDYINFVAPERHGGEASYSFKKLASLGIHSLVSQTTKPLQITGYLGGIVMIISALLAVFLLIEMFVFHDAMKLGVSSSGFLALFISFLVGVVLACQWMLALYIENIHNETQNRPLYIVAETDDEA